MAKCVEVKWKRQSVTGSYVGMSKYRKLYKLKFYFRFIVIVICRLRDLHIVQHCLLHVEICELTFNYPFKQRLGQKR